MGIKLHLLPYPRKNVCWENRVQKLCKYETGLFFLWGEQGRNKTIKFCTLVWNGYLKFFFCLPVGYIYFLLACVSFSQKISSHVASKLLVLTTPRLCWWSWFSVENLQFCIITVGDGGRKGRERRYRYTAALKIRSNITSSQSIRKSHSSLEKPSFGPHMILHWNRFTGTRGRKI